jgi:hypothetical protein
MESELDANRWEEYKESLQVALKDICLYEVLGTPQTYNNILFVPAIFDFCKGTPLSKLTIRGLANLKTDLVYWIFGRIKFLFDCSPAIWDLNKDDYSDPEETVFCDFIVIDQEAELFSNVYILHCRFNYEEIIIYLQRNMSISLKNKISTSFYHLLFLSPQNTDDFYIKHYSLIMGSQVRNNTGENSSWSETEIENDAIEYLQDEDKYDDVNGWQYNFLYHPLLDRKLVDVDNVLPYGYLPGEDQYKKIFS